jgi:Tol biopolymer transport system component
VRLTILVALLCLILIVPSPAARSASSGSNAGIAWADDGVFASNTDGSGVRRLVPSVADQHFGPAWSPDGDALVFSGRNSDSVDVHLYDAATETRRVLDFSGRWTAPRSARVFSYLLDAAWSPDGTHLAFSDWSTPLSSTIRVAPLDTRRLRSVTTSHSGTDSNPAWSPDGAAIAFERRRSARAAPAIMLVRPDGRGLRRLTSGTSPSWSPDGRRLVLAWGDAIYRIDRDGSSRVRLARGLNARGAGLQPRWSPDGRKILYLSTRGIWTMDLDGTGRARIVHGPLVSGAGWRPGS